MKEVGVDISAQESHRVTDFLAEDIDAVITVCDEAARSCPTFPTKVNMICHSFDDPVQQTAALENEEDKLAVYRRVRDEIRNYIASLPTTSPFAIAETNNNN